jgi:chromosome segregation protein
MQISRLRLVGFKSFVEPTELSIAPGLTGVVGPNGCGKSNLLEAIRWVMGESSPKSMRGGGMDDVIFAGTESRPSRDFAEVALLCETSGDVLPGTVRVGDNDEEVEIVRRIERGAGSAYRANGHDVRARDVALIFADAATGAHSPALVSQGKVAGIIAAKPQERRMLLEEAAGIAGLHVRRKEAEQKLRATETNLARLADILAEMDARAGALRRQARAAERYTRLTESIRIAEGRMIFARWRDAAAAADAARAEMAAAESAVAEAQSAQGAANHAQVTAMAALGAAREAATQAREAEHKLATKLLALRADAAAAELKMADLDSEEARIGRDREAEDALAREGAAAIERLEAAARAATSALTALDAERPGQERAAQRAADALRDAEVALAETRAQATNESAERRIAEAADAESARREERITAELTRLTREREGLGDLGAATTSASAAIATLARLAEAASTAEAAVAEAAAQREAADSSFAAAQQALAEGRASLAALDSEAAALDRSLAASAGDGDGVIASLKVTPGYETALAAALGDDLSAPLLSDAAGARGWKGAAAEADPPLADGLTPLAARVEAPTALARRLAQIGVADNDTGQRLAVGQRLVTRDGRLRRWDGFVASGDGAAAADRLVRRNRREALAQQRPEVADGVAQLTAMAEQSAAARDSGAQALATARAAFSAAEQAARAARRSADDAEAAAQRLTERSARVDEQLTVIAAEAELASTARRETRAALSALPDGAAMAARLSADEAAAAAARETVAAARATLAGLEADASRQREAQIEATAEIKGWRARAGEAARRISSMAERSRAIADERARLAERPAQLAGQISGAEAEEATLTERLAAALTAEATATEKAREADQILEAIREGLATARERRAAATAHAESAESRRIEMGRISGERFQCPPPLLPATAGFVEEEVGSPQAEGEAHERLTQDRERIGPVNLVAATELAELEAEQATSAAEAEELHQAVNRLRGSIGHLNREGRARLLEAFTQVDTHFQRLFTTLFGGGSAHLALTESDDPLEAGLEIMAQPPGKKLATLTLLSGGEQALTAIALIFALFLTNPAPICVLDEVDAPLDDANVERFCDLLDAMTRETKTRYLIVTHNAVTMARMHRLFGVTMVERGISRLVSVDLGEAEELLAAE